MGVDYHTAALAGFVFDLNNVEGFDHEVILDGYDSQFLSWLGFEANSPDPVPVVKTVLSNHKSHQVLIGFATRQEKAEDWGKDTSDGSFDLPSAAQLFSLGRLKAALQSKNLIKAGVDPRIQVITDGY